MKQDKENRFSGMTPAEIKLEARRQIVRSTFLALAALIVIGVACYAWFVSSKVVTAILGPVSMGDMTFELASVGEVSAFDADTPANYTVPEGEEYDTPSGKKWWTFGNQTIQWRMTGEANLENDTDEKGLRPGSDGHLSFYVIPKGDGPLTVKFDLEIVPLKENPESSGSWQEVSDTSDAAKLLRGHLLFAYPQYENGAPVMNDDKPVMTLANYSDGSFAIDFGNVTANTPIEVTLNWFWPNTLADALNSGYGETIAGWMKDSGDYFFYNDSKPVTIPPDTAKETILVDSDLNNYFNNADLYIGDEIDAVILRLNAQKAS